MMNMMRPASIRKYHIALTVAVDEAVTRGELDTMHELPHRENFWLLEKSGKWVFPHSPSPRQKH
jgi:hypothetical protein